MNILELLRKIAPNIVFSVLWTPDDDFEWNGDGPDPAENGLYAYDVDFSAKTIVDGNFVTGRSSLGGCYSKPGEFDPDVHGYLVQNLLEASEELAVELNKTHHVDPKINDQLVVVICVLKAKLKHAYNTQRKVVAE